jgi:hypothetical protein
MKQWQSPQSAARPALIVGAQAAAAQAYHQEKLPTEVSGIPWYADARGEAWRALSIKRAPVLLGIRQGRIEGTTSAHLKGPAALTSAVRSWVEY